MTSPAGVARAARRESCSSISASNPTASGSGSRSTSTRPEADPLGRQVVPRHGRARRCRVALVEDEVDHPQHRVEPLGQFGLRRHLVGNARVADLVLRPHDSLRQRRRRRQERACDLLRRQPADLAQRQRHLRVRRQRRMAAGEDQPQAVVLDALRIGKRGGVVHGDVGGRARFVERREALLAPEAVDRLESPCRHQPRPRVRRHAFARPLFERGPERVVQRLLRHVEVAEQPDQRRQDATRLGLIDGVHRLMYLIGCLHRARSDHLHGGRRKPADRPRTRFKVRLKPDTTTLRSSCSMVERRRAGSTNGRLEAGGWDD